MNLANLWCYCQASATNCRFRPTPLRNQVVFLPSSRGWKTGRLIAPEYEGTGLLTYYDYMKGSKVLPDWHFWLLGTKNPHVGIVVWEFRLGKLLHRQVSLPPIILFPIGLRLILNHSILARRYTTIVLDDLFLDRTDCRHTDEEDGGPLEQDGADAVLAVRCLP